MASNVKVSLVSGKLVIECELDKVAKRTSKDTGDVLASIDFEKLSALVGATGVMGEIKVSLGVYLMDKSRNAATSVPAGKPAKRIEDMSLDELRAYALAQAQGTPTPTQASKPAASAPVAAPATKKPRSPAQLANDDKFAANGKARLEAMRAGKVTETK
jgi:hypothetical protein